MEQAGLDHPAVVQLLQVHMRNALLFSVALLMIGSSVYEQPTTAPLAGTELTSGWTLLKEGQGDATVEADAAHPSSESKHLLHISCTKTPGPGEGRAGATNSVTIPVEQGQWFDVTFSAINERGSVGLVFSLETADGKVFARTTLPEIGRRMRGPP